MSRLSKAALITFVVATLAGSCLHFLYALWPNGLTALLAPVNESLWEHVKILYWPCLLSGVLLVRREPESLGARAFSLLLSAAVMLGVGYLYHVVLEGDSLFFDVALYVLVPLCAGDGRLFPAALFPPHSRLEPHTPALGGAGAGAGRRHLCIYLVPAGWPAVPGSLPARLLFASLLSMSHFGREYVLVGPEGFFHRKRRNAHVRTRRPFAPQRGRRSPPAPVRLYPVGAGLVPARGRP